MKTKSLFLVLILSGCGGADVPMTTTVVTTEANGTTATSATTPEVHVASVMPDLAKLRAHSTGHITFPATREQVLATCADTPEFTAEEKQWISEHLPEGTYASAEDVLKALGA